MGNFIPEETGEVINTIRYGDPWIFSLWIDPRDDENLH
jgi:hypothetical protein